MEVYQGWTAVVIAFVHMLSNCIYYSILEFKDDGIGSSC